MPSRPVVQDQRTLFGLLFVSIFTTIACAVEQKPLEQSELRYKYGDPIPVSCLNRTIETGEHISDASGRLQYIPFPTCNETGRPLELYFGVERELNCTIDSITDELFHLLEFYIHNDAPLTCRIPSRPMSIQTYLDPALQVGVLGSESTAYTTFIVALSGILQLSHLHVANNLNVLLHAAPRSVALGVIDAATAYSISAGSRNTKIVVGDPLPFKFSVRWYPSATLPSGWQGVGGHVTGWTMIYCLLSAGASAALCITYCRGFELPRRLRSHGRDRVGLLGGEKARTGGYGYGYGLGAGAGSTIGDRYGFSGSGKVD